MLPCCERCLGLYVGAAVALWLHMWLRPKLTGRFLECHGLFLLLMVPLGFHWVPQGAVVRTISGVLFGAGIATFLWLPLADRASRWWNAKAASALRSAAALQNASRNSELSGYAVGIFFGTILLPFLASYGGRGSAFILTALATAGLLSLAVLVAANLVLGTQVLARYLRRLRLSQTVRTP